MSPALRPVRAIMDKLGAKPVPLPLTEPAKRVEPTWRMAKAEAITQRRDPLTTKSTSRIPHTEQTSLAAHSGSGRSAP
jgi:hypothetical protein